MYALGECEYAYEFSLPLSEAVYAFGYLYAHLYICIITYASEAILASMFCVGKYSLYSEIRCITLD